MKNKEFRSIPFMSGVDGDVSVTIINATFKKINDLANQYPDPDFGAWLMDQIYNKKQILAKIKGLFKKRLLCSSCQTELDINPQEQRQIELDLQYKEFSPFKILITISSVICPQCNKICGVDLDGNKSYRLNEAVIAAFESENITP